MCRKRLHLLSASSVLVPLRQLGPGPGVGLVAHTVWFGEACLACARPRTLILPPGSDIVLKMPFPGQKHRQVIRRLHCQTPLSPHGPGSLCDPLFQFTVVSQAPCLPPGERDEEAVGRPSGSPLPLQECQWHVCRGTRQAYHPRMFLQHGAWVRSIGTPGKSPAQIFVLRPDVLHQSSGGAQHSAFTSLPGASAAPKL